MRSEVARRRIGRGIFRIRSGQSEVLSPVPAAGRNCGAHRTARLSGFGVQREKSRLQGPTRHDLLLRLGVAAFLWANIMAFSVILYVGYFEQIAQSASRYPALPPSALWRRRWSSIAPIRFFVRPAIGLRNLQIRMEVLLSLGILTAYASARRRRCEVRRMCISIPPQRLSPWFWQASSSSAAPKKTPLNPLR